MRHIVATISAAIALSAGVALANPGASAGDANASRSPYEQICESASLRSMERADCHAQMKLARDDNQRRDIYRVFDVRMNGTLAGDPPAPPADAAERTGG